MAEEILRIKIVPDESAIDDLEAKAAKAANSRGAREPPIGGGGGSGGEPTPGPADDGDSEDRPRKRKRGKGDEPPSVPTWQDYLNRAIGRGSGWGNALGAADKLRGFQGLLQDKGGILGTASGLAGKAAGLLEGPQGGLIHSGVMAVLRNAQAGGAMAQQGIGQGAQGILSGNATGILKGGANLAGGVASAAAGPVFGSLIRQFTAAITGVMDQLDQMSSRLAKYNGSIAASQLQYEAAQERYNMKLAKAVEPLLVSWNRLKVSTLDLADKVFMPIVKGFSDYAGNLIGGFDRLVGSINRTIEEIDKQVPFLAKARAAIWEEVPRFLGGLLFGPAAGILESLGKNAKKQKDIDITSLLGPGANGASGSARVNPGLIAPGPMGGRVGPSQRHLFRNSPAHDSRVSDNPNYLHLPGSLAAAYNPGDSRDKRFSDEEKRRAAGGSPQNPNNGNPLRPGDFDPVTKKVFTPADKHFPPAPNGIFESIKQDVRLQLQVTLSNEREIFEMAQRTRELLMRAFEYGSSECQMFNNGIIGSTMGL